MQIYDFADSQNWPLHARRIFDLADRESFFNLLHWYRHVAQFGLNPGSKAFLALESSARLAMACCGAPNDRTMRSCTNLYTCEFALLGERENCGAIADFAREIAAAVDRLDGIQFEGLDPSSAYFDVMLNGIRDAGLVAKAYFGWGTWYESVPGVDFETYLSARPSILRNTWKRKRELLKKRGNANFQLLGRADEVEPLIAIYEHVRERSWKSAEPFPDFIPNLMRLAGKLGALRFGALIIDGIPAAAQFWIVWGGKATIYKLVYAREFAAVSPGTVLTMEMVRNVLEEDSPVEINFGRGDDAYKKLWLSARREHWGIEAANPRTLGGILRASRIRAAVFRNRLKSKVHTDNRSP